MKSPSEKLILVRNWMRGEGFDALVLLQSDPHQSEYMPAYWKVIEWLTGFTGSAATVVITGNEAMLWTDSRYYIQAEKELLGTPFRMMKLTGKPEDGYVKWLCRNLDKNETVGVDGQLISIRKLRSFEQDLASAGIHIMPFRDPFNKLWEDRPKLPSTPVFRVPDALVGRTREQNIARLREHLKKKQAQCMLLTDLDEICWVLNIRGGDIPCNTSTLSYLIVSGSSVELFIDRSKLSGQLCDLFSKEGIRIHDYTGIRAFIVSKGDDESWLTDPAQCNYSLYDLLPEGKVVEAPSEVCFLKAVKSDEEIAAIRRTMIKDGIALTRAFMWLERTIRKRTVTEYEFARVIAESRSEQEGYFTESFPAIVGYQEHGAVVHYRPDEKESKEITSNGILLVDSGGHYETGTTDITRMIALSAPSKEFIQRYTAVLKGHIALSSVIFPEGTMGYHLDAFARQHLWSAGLNYGHGTGHGVGFFASVHEGPYGISPAVSGGRKYPFVPGIVLSNEPGYYKEGDYGIRIENLVLVTPWKDTPDGSYYAFETLTLFPIELGCVDESMLTRKEVNWIDTYHERVRAHLLPAMENEEEKHWLTEKTKPIGRGK